MVFWDFKTSRIVNRTKVHSQAIISHAWLPHESVRFDLREGSWDGMSADDAVLFFFLFGLCRVK